MGSVVVHESGETVLLEDWYQQYPSHSIGSVRFGSDGYLYVGGGDGASYLWADWGQRGNPAWPDTRSPPGHGGALRPGDPAHLTLIDPSTQWTVRPAEFASRSRNSPYAGTSLPASVVTVLFAGRPTVLDGKAQA